jgi:uncharacterized protein YeaC (DUF1315 family)
MKKGTIDTAIVAHRGWISRFETALKGINTEFFDEAKIRNATACDLGYWLDSGQAGQIIEDETLQKVRVLHDKFHQISGELALQINQRALESSKDTLLSELDAVSKQIIHLLMDAKKRTEGVTYRVAH